MFRYTISAPNPDDHLLHVRVELGGLTGRDTIDLSMPAWTPGSYLLREYARHVQNIRATDAAGRELPVRQADKATWTVSLDGADAIDVRYELFSHELAVRMNHVDGSHAFFNAPSTYLYHADWIGERAEVRFEGFPEDWEVFCGLEPLDGTGLAFGAADMDVLFDAPVEIGPHTPLEFDALGVPHRIVCWGGQANFDPHRMVEETRRIVEANAAAFGGSLPYDHYTIIVHLKEGGRGGLEHLNSTVLLWNPEGFRAGVVDGLVDEAGHIIDPAYLNYMRLVSHEHYHVWNVKRIRPERLGPFDYQRENYTRDLWTVEGVTSYYEVKNLVSGGLMSASKFLEVYAGNAKALDAVPGRALHSLEDASFNAWVKLYRPDEHTKNSSVSYYLKGELACFMLDAHLLAATDGARGLDDVLRALWAHFVETGEGYAEGSYPEWVERATGVDARDFIAHLVASTDEYDYDATLAPFGLRLERTHSGGAAPAWFGATLRGNAVSFVPTGSPAHRAGIYVGDDVIALDGRRLNDLGAELKRRAPGDTVRVHLFRRGELLEREVELGAAPADAYAITSVDDPTPAHLALRKAWLHDTLTEDDA